MSRVEEFNSKLREYQKGHTETQLVTDRKAAFAAGINKKKEAQARTIPGSLDAVRENVASTWFKASDEVGGLDRTGYHDNPQRARHHAAEMEKLREERAAEKQWYDKYSNLNVDLAAAAQRAAEAGQKNVQDEIYQLTQQANLYFSNNMEEERSEALKRLEYLEGLDAENSARLQQLQQDIATAQYLQKQQMYAGKQAEADTYAASQPASGRWTAEEIDRKIQETDNRLQMLNASGQFEEADALKAELDRLYQLRRVSEYGQDSERNLYDYLQSEDPAEAQAYLQHLQETMNYRKGMEQVSDIRGIDNDILRTLAIGAHSVGTGMANAGAGFNQLLSEEAIPTTAMQYASEELMGELGTVGRLLYSAGSTVGNMLPTILLSVGLGAVGVPGAVAGGIASSAMGASVAGNTYTQAVKEGYAPDKAKTYAALVGASEAALQYLLGGIGKLGGVADEAILAKVKTIDNVLARMALTGTVKIGSEVGEEELQLFLEPAIRSVVFSEGYNVPQMEEIIETAVVSALSTGLLEGPGIISAGFERPDMGSNPVQTSESAVDPVMAQAAEMLKRDSAKKADGEPLASAPAAAAEVPQTSSARKNAPPSAAPAVLQNEQVQDTEVANAVLRSAAKGFGKEGAQNLLLAYDGQSSTNYLGGFRVYYEAGLSGRGMDKVESVFSGYLTDNQKQLAYGAGQIDAARSLEAEIGAVASATVYGKEAGLVRNQEAAKLERTVASSLNKLGKATGVKILVEDMAEGVNGSFDVKSGIIRLNAKATNPLLTVAAHEVTHRMQQMSPKEYRAFRDFAVNAISEQIGSSAIREIEARYARNDVKLTHEEAMDEVAAEFAEAMVKDETLFRKLTQENRTAAQKFVDAVKAFIEKVKAAFSKDSKTQDSHAMQKYGVDMKTLEAAAKKWEAALEATEKAVQGKENTASEGGEVRYAVKDGGFNAYAVQTALYDALDHEDSRHDNLISVGQMPRYITENYGISGEMYIYRNHAYENMVSREQAVSDGRPVTRGGKEIHFHDLGVEKMTNAILGINDPTMAISTKSKEGNPTVIMILPEFGNNGAPLYAVLSFYSNRDINGSFERKPHIVLTIAERPYVGEGGRSGYQEIIKSAIEEGRVLDYNKKRGDDLSVIANPTRVGNITETFLKKNVAQFRKEVNEYKERNKIQYSLADHGELNAAEIKAVMQENAMLKERVDYWKGQTKRTTKPTMDKKAVAKAARDLVREYGADVDIAEDLQSLYNDIVSGKDGDGEMTGEAAFRRAADIAAQLVENAVAKDDTLYQEYADLRQFLRSTKLVISEEASHDIPDFGDFRKVNMGRISVGKGQSNIQEIYRDLAEDYPALFDEQRTVTESDQLLEIAEVMEKIYTVTEYNPYSRYMEQAVTGTANEILEKFFDLPETKPTFADRQAKAMQDLKDKAGQHLAKERADHAQRLQELRQQNRQKVQEAIQKERDRRVKEVDNLKSQYAARDLKGRERRNARELRAKITRHAKALSQKLLRPTDKQHIPEQFKVAVATVLDSINLESNPNERAFVIDKETKRRVYLPEGTPTKRTTAFLKLKEAYTEIRDAGGLVDDPNLLGDGNIQGWLDKAAVFADKRIAEMSAEELDIIWKTIRALEHAISSYGKSLASEKYATTAEWADHFRNDTSSRKPKKYMGKDRTSLDMETPLTFFSHFGNAGMDIYHLLRDAQDSETTMQRQVVEAVQKVVKPGVVEKLEKAHHNFKTERGHELVLTTAQIMDIYNLSKRKQAQEHLMEGGVVQPEIKGAKIKEGNGAIKLSLKDLETIIATLNDEQKATADALQRVTTLLAEFGNKASMKVYGYKKFTDADYWPIHSTTAGVHWVAEKSHDNAASIKNIGLAKPVVPGANNALDIESVFEVFARHSTEMIRYSAWLATMEDMNRLYNYRYKEGDSSQSITVKDMLNTYAGKGADKYWETLMMNIQNGVRSRETSLAWKKVAKIIGTSKGASVAWNPRVVIQQPTAYLRAAVVLDPKYMAQCFAGATKGNAWQKAQKYAPIAARKADGMFDMGSSTSMKDAMFGTQSRLQKVNEFGLAGAAAADAVTWGGIWNACEHQVADTQKSLKVGSELFYQAVAKVFTDVIDQTQVVDGVLQRAQIMRSSNASVKEATSFMGEPIMGYNILVRAKQALTEEKDSAKRKSAAKHFARAAIAMLATDMINALAQSLPDAWRDDDEDKTYWEKFWSAFTGVTGDEETVADFAMVGLKGNVGSNVNPLGRIPFVSDVLSLIQGYEVNRPEAQVASDILNAAIGAADSAFKENRKMRLWYTATELAHQVAKLFGVGVGNLKRDILGIVRTFAADSGNIPLQYELEKAIYSLTSDKNTGRYMDIMFRALKQNDLDSFRKISVELMNTGLTDGMKIDSAMKSRLAKEKKRDPSFDLSQDAQDLIASISLYEVEEELEVFGADDLDAVSYRAYAEQRGSDYRVWEDELIGKPFFGNLENDTKNALLNAAYKVAHQKALEDNSDGKYQVDTKWVNWALDGEAHGVDVTEAILFKTAYDMVTSDYDQDGKLISGSKKENTLEQAIEWMPWLTTRELEYLKSNYWSD